MDQLPPELQNPNVDYDNKEENQKQRNWFAENKRLSLSVLILAVIVVGGIMYRQIGNSLKSVGLPHMSIVPFPDDYGIVPTEEPSPSITPVTEVSSFESCAAAGYPIMESYPEKCSTPDGVTFVKPNPDEMCIQVIAMAKNPQTGETRAFPTPCDVPEGWIAASSEPAGGQFCGGIAGVACPLGYICKLDGNYPDAGGMCVK